MFHSILDFCLIHFKDINENQIQKIQSLPATFHTFEVNRIIYDKDKNALLPFEYEFSIDSEVYESLEKPLIFQPKNFIIQDLNYLGLFSKIYKKIKKECQHCLTKKPFVTKYRNISKEEKRTCHFCNGTQRIKHHLCNENGKNPCRGCGEKGYYFKSNIKTTCPLCEGTGFSNCSNQHCNKGYLNCKCENGFEFEFKTVVESYEESIDKFCPHCNDGFVEINQLEYFSENQVFLHINNNKFLLDFKISDWIHLKNIKLIEHNGESRLFNVPIMSLSVFKVSKKNPKGEYVICFNDSFFCLADLI